MILMYGSHLVKDFEIWKRHFDADEQRRSMFGIRTIYLMQADDNKNNVHFLLSGPSRQAFEEMMHDPSVSNIGNKAGVLDIPQVHFLKQVK